MSICKWPRCSCRATGNYCPHKPGEKAPKRIKRVSTKRLAQLKEDQAVGDQDAAFYLWVWRERLHRCECCGVALTFTTPDIRNYSYHHLLEKRNFPQYRYCKWNIMLLCRNCHDSWERNPDTRPTITKLRNSLLKRHDEGQLKPCIFRQAH